MKHIFNQTTTIFYINIYSLKNRLGLSISTIFSVALVVGVLICFLSMSKGFEKTLEGSGAEDVAVVLRGGSMSELNSVITINQARLIESGPGIEKFNNNPLVSKELYVVVDAIKKSSNTPANIPLRGIDKTGEVIRESVSIIKGKMFTPGTNEIVVGKALIENFNGFELGSLVKLGKADWKVVGIFASPGTVFESEIWADIDVVQSFFNRSGIFQTIRVKMKNSASVFELEKYSDSDPRLKLDVKSEKDFYLEQTNASSDLIFYLGWPLSILMSIGSLAGAINTMYNSVVARTKDIITLRIIGFDSSATFFGTMLESLLLTSIGAVIGIICAYLLFDGLTTSTLSGNFTQVVFSFKMTFDLFIKAIFLSLGIGLIGGLMPALRAARMPLIQINSFN
ncbi:MAG: ABC transporter permease [Legionellales bacterium]|nr:ABC transporter permease [Legionellales bacterium]